MAFLVLVDLCWVDIYVDDPGARGKGFQLPCHTVIEADAKGLGETPG